VAGGKAVRARTVQPLRAAAAPAASIEELQKKFGEQWLNTLASAPCIYVNQYVD
jgi:hypothetical protein